ncbi:hypothetical protein MBLNU230_g8176t1 [Neophaeotheca triangularis]
MAVYTTRDGNIPATLFSCPPIHFPESIKTPGTLSTTASSTIIPYPEDYCFGRNPDEYDCSDEEPNPIPALGLCGIKGYHPRMYECCKTVSPFIYPGQLPEPRIALAEDACTQWCPPVKNMDAWLYCLTRDGHNVTNAFCQATTGRRRRTSGSEPRDGPVDPDSTGIERHKESVSGSCVTRPKAGRAWAVVGLSLVAFGLWCHLL